MPRFYCPVALQPDQVLSLPPGAARHVQVLRLQPGDAITLFDGLADGEYAAAVELMGRSEVRVRVGAFSARSCEPDRRVHLALGMPANERMDWLVEKATELGVASIQPLLTERSVVKLSGERADKKVAHWQAVAIAACEQCGANRVPTVHPVASLADWLARPRDADAVPLLLSLQAGSRPLRAALSADAPTAPVLFLSGPEGGLSAAEEAAALARGFAPVSLGARVLRAETAALAALAALLV